MSARGHFLTLYSSTQSFINNQKVIYLPQTMNFITTSNSSISQDIYKNISAQTGSFSFYEYFVSSKSSDIFVKESSLNYVKIIP